jgi:hypothetical protein
LVAVVVVHPVQPQEFPAEVVVAHIHRRLPIPEDQERQDKVLQAVVVQEVHPFRLAVGVDQVLSGLMVRVLPLEMEAQAQQTA